jgi:hypothetical protein
MCVCVEYDTRTAVGGGGSSSGGGRGGMGSTYF